MSFGSLLQRIQRGLSTVELVHTSHPRWPLPPGPSTSPTVQISVLDSSFNPPTLAHLALANALPPPPRNAPSTLAPHDFDARLLLLSVRNADKQLKAGDATYEQRMEMMVLLAQELAPTLSQPLAREPNVAVAIIDEPTFVGKSAALLDFLRKRILDLHRSPGVIFKSPSHALPSPKLTFLMGTDTIVRFFAHRYYPNERAMATSLRQFFSPDENDSRIICVRRTSGLSGAAEESVEIQIPDFIREIPPAERISFVDIGDEERTLSSSQVRVKLANREESWRSMLSPVLAHYIAEHCLYSPSQ
uniref:Fatty acid synthase subunit alpha (EC) n=1 Tax=Ganoderma boninense TaxID=34458 RepID=A0A5K1K1G2_9APHY|nr:Fatty acid synthase subunit alpha (EC [Includes: Acyl carrier, 3-oxoacyl-[acyl-carrier-protein] reductase (EC (Beta-ketoacyl reductase), 3-oxoacyl-[acyl-carrier-protein] synthase (EC (Beta-ketoacyl synthase)] [Ganoderma boninense]